jgi:hypothetical protein
MAACRAATDRKTFEGSLSEDGEEALDCVERGGRGLGEVEGQAWMARQPLLHRGMLVGGVIAEDCVDLLAWRETSRK